MHPKPKLPSLLSIKKPCQDFDRSCKNSDRSGEFGKLPGDVLALPNLKPTAKLVFAVLAMDSKGTTRRVALSDGVIAVRAGISRPSVIEGLRTLSAAGFIEAAGDPVKQVQAYRIKHRTFRATAPEVEAAPPETKASGAKDGFVKCPKCHKRCKGLLKVGWCRSCSWHLKIERIAERVYDRRGMEKTA